MPSTALLIGHLEPLRMLERQLGLLAQGPRSAGWVVCGAGDESRAAPDEPVLGKLADLEWICRKHAPDLALVTIPGIMRDQISQVRTQLRRLGVPDRYFPPIADLLAGTGPRSVPEVDLARLIGRPPRVIDESAVRSVVQGRRVLVTGAGGSIGQELARIVAAHDPARLVLMDRSENALFEIDRQIARSHTAVARRAVLHDIVDADRTLEIFRAEEPELVFHAAAHKHVPMMEDHPGAAVDNNLFGTKAVADAADETGVDRFVMISTDKAVNPVSIMGATKRLAELYVQFLTRHSGTAFSMVRFGNVLGSSGSVLDIWARQLADGGPVTVTDPRMTRYFMTIPEAATLVIESAALIDPDAESGEVFVLDMGEPVRILDLASRYIEAHHLTPLLPGNPDPVGDCGLMPVVFTGIRPGEKLFEELSFDAECMAATRHPHIHVWNLPAPEEGLVKDMIFALSPEIRSTDARHVAASIRRLIPEMKASSAR